MSLVAFIVSSVATLPASSFPVDPADVEDAVRVVKYTILRHADRGPLDDDLARMIVAGVIAILSEPAADPGTVEAAAAVVSEFTAATGAVVTLQAAGVPA
jgi:hypothetical protein